MSDEQNTQPNADAAPKKERVVKTLDQRIAEAQAAVAKAEAALASLVSERDNRERYENLAAGQVVSFEFGRAEKRRVLTGTVLSIHDDPKGGRILVVQSGEGLDIQINKVAATAIIFEAAANVTAEPEAAAVEAAAESPSDVLAGVA